MLDDQADLADLQGQERQRHAQLLPGPRCVSAPETTLLKNTANSNVTAVQAVDRQIQSTTVRGVSCASATPARLRSIALPLGTPKSRPAPAAPQVRRSLTGHALANHR